MESEMTHKDIAELLHLLLDMGEILLNSGAEINRVEDTLTRIGKAYGAVSMNVFVITSSIVATLQSPNGYEITQTRRVLSSSSTNFTRLEKINDLSRRCCASPLPLNIFREELTKANCTSNTMNLYIGSILAASGFSVFFGGTIADGIVAALFAVLICLLQKKFMPLCPNLLIFNLLCSFITGLGICLLSQSAMPLHIDKIMIGDIMLLIPGISITNSVRDILVGDTISGIVRLIECLLWSGALALGFISAIWLIGG